MDAAAESFYALCGGLYATGGGTVVPALGNLFSPLPLMMLINCLSYFSGIGRLLIALDGATFVAMLCPGVFLLMLCLCQAKLLGEICFPSLVGPSRWVVRKGLFLKIRILVFDALCSIFCRSLRRHLHLLHIFWVSTLRVVLATV